MADSNPFDQFDTAPPPAATAAPSAAPASNPFDQFDTKQAAPAAVSSDTSSPDETASRVVGLGDRAIIKGIGQLADVPGALVSLADRAGKSMHDYTRHLMGLPEDTTEAPAETAPTGGSRGADAVGDVLGLPKPATGAERIGSAAVSGLPSALLVPEAPIATALSTMGGGAASQGAEEAGAGPVGRTVAGLLGGGVGALGSAAAAGARGIVRGGAQGQAAMQGRLADAAANGTNLTAGQAGGSSAVQYLEGVSSKGWGGGPINKAAEAQNESLGNSVNRIVSNLTPSGDASPMTAGSAIIKGIGDNKTPGSAFGNMHAAESDAYNKLDSLVHPDTPIDMSGTLAKLDSLAAPTPGAANTTGSLTSSKISRMRDDLRADLEASQQPGGAAQKPLYTAGGNPPALPAGALPYSAARALRSAVGNSIDWGFAPADPATNGGLKQVYGALSGDLKSGASAVSPEASGAANAANRLYAANQATREALTPIVDRAGGPEAVYQAATNGTKQGATKISQVMTALNPDQQNLVRATVLSRLGRAVPSSQNAEGSAFSPSTYLSNWNKLDPDAKDALFGESGNAADLRSGLDSIAATTGNIRAGTKLRNPSGTGEAVGHGVGMAAAWEGITHLLAGHPATLAATAGGVGANNLLARALTNPKTVQWLAKSTKAPTSALPNAVNQLSQMDDPDAQDLAQHLTPPVARASGGRVDNIDALVNKLIKRWKAAKKETDAGTKPMLKLPDATVVKALEIAGRGV